MHRAVGRNPPNFHAAGDARHGGNIPTRQAIAGKRETIPVIGKRRIWAAKPRNEAEEAD
jgi:hypothetical protein